MYPLLKIFEDGQVHKTGDLYDQLAREFSLTEEQRAEYLPSGKQLVYRNRIGWARTYLFKAGLLEQVQRGVYRISERGQSILNDSGITTLTRKDLMGFDEFRDFQNVGTKVEPIQPVSLDPIELNPEEQLTISYAQLKNALKKELLEKVKLGSPEFFEELVVKLLVSMGYGGSIEDAGKAIGRSGDEGIDGIIKEDVLGLEMIYLQAKRWEGSVGRPEIQKFAGSLAGQQAQKGVFITTSDFTVNALDYVSKIGMKIILISGKELAEFMFQYNIGVSEDNVFIVKKIDEDFFIE
ncbi:restriction endonuclease [Sporosarcina sp. G11-34]|uniref:restriction endonuclease n=1 Tax=Sporosarcina sp. G11-34 TaxID=2849605 RepID=UPI0022A9EF2F|nr:restriction endonuclease [Sporosarcina sp. G11-34]MCZ2259869.1 restriction endonuclease [Sporosarcina sp. G11-34]